MRQTRSLLLLMASAALAAFAEAQVPGPGDQLPRPGNPVPPSENPAPQTEPEPAPHVPLSEQLHRQEGVLKPPSGIDPEIRRAPPDPVPGKMPVIPPPGEPGGDPSIQPK